MAFDISSLAGNRSAYNADTPVHTLDGARLNRPLSPTRPVIICALIAALIACIFGGILVFRLYDSVINAPLHEQEALEAALAAETQLDIPAIAPLMALDDRSIMDRFTAEGLTMMERTTPEESAAGTFEAVKLPADLSAADAALIYAQGIENASASQAVKLLKGSWLLQVDRTDGIIMRVRYGDFDANSAQEALATALASQGLSEDMAADSGIDDAGNTYMAGAQAAEDGTEYQWRISVCNLKDVYDINGIPDNAQYVGIRYTL